MLFTLYAYDNVLTKLHACMLIDCYVQVCIHFLAQGLFTPKVV